MNFPRAILSFLFSLFLCQIVYYYPNLPEKVAVHFNAFGEPDNWASKQSYLIFQIILLLFTAVITFGLPLLLRKLPDSAINIPHKDYWLAPQRRNETFTILQKRFEWFGVGLCALMISINQLAIRANLLNQNLSPVSWYILGVFLLFVVVWSVNLCKDFKVTE
jgi:uncharacterized membrane protein